MNPGRSAETMTCLPSVADELADRLLGLVGRVAAADQLDERHDRDRAEEVHPDEALASLRARRPRRGGGSRSTTCSRRRSPEPGAIASSSRQRADLTATSSKTASMTRSASATRARSDGRLGSGRASRRGPPGRAGPWRRRGRGCRDPVAAGLGAREVRLVEVDREADRGVDLGDAVAHQPGAGHEDPFDRHGPQRTASAARRWCAPGLVRRRVPARRTGVAPMRRPMCRNVSLAPMRAARPEDWTGAIPNAEVARKTAERSDDRAPILGRLPIETASETIAGMMKATSDRVDGRSRRAAPVSRDSADHGRPIAASGRAPRWRARPARHPIGTVAPTTRSTIDDQRVDGSGRLDAGHADRLGVARQEGEEAGHPPRARQDDRDPGRARRVDRAVHVARLSRLLQRAGASRGPDPRARRRDPRSAPSSSQTVATVRRSRRGGASPIDASDSRAPRYSDSDATLGASPRRSGGARSLARRERIGRGRTPRPHRAAPARARAIIELVGDEVEDHRRPRSARRRRSSSGRRPNRIGRPADDRAAERAMAIATVAITMPTALRGPGSAAISRTRRRFAARTDPVPRM